MTKRGRIKWFNNETGWGFIEGSGDADIFVRHDRVVGQGYKALQEGDLVEYELRTGEQGPYAMKVVPIRGEKNARQQRAS